jgi:hypothetical protein
MNKITFSLLIILFAAHTVQATTSAQSAQPQPPKELFKEVIITPHRVDFIIEDEFKNRYLSDNLYAEYQDIDLTKLPRSVVHAPGLMNLVSLVWASGKEYSVEVMDKEMYESLIKVKEVIKALYPQTQWDGNLIPKKLESKNIRAMPRKKNRLALLFSGGLDSVYSSFKNADKKQLLITIIGNTDFPPHRLDVWNSAKPHYERFAQTYGHDITYLRSNFWFFLNRANIDHVISPEIVSWRMDAVEGLGWAGMVAPILYAKKLPMLRVASSISWDFPARIFSTPIVDDTIKIAGIQMHQDGFGVDRVEKFKFIGEFCKAHNLPRPVLKVCSKPGIKNCNTCVKCLQTIAEAMIAKEKPQTYGFKPGSTKDLKKQLAKKVKRKKYSKRRIWHFWSIQKRIKELMERGEKVNGYLKWLVKTPIPYTPEVDWRSFMNSFSWYQRTP